MTSSRPSTASPVRRILVAVPIALLVGVVTAVGLPLLVPQDGQDEATQQEGAQEKAAQEKAIQEKAAQQKAAAQQKTVEKGHEGHDHGPGQHDAAGKQYGHNQAGSQKMGPYGGATDENAKLEIPEGKGEHDFGRVLQGATLEHEFRVASAGTSDLVVRQVKPTCGCTVSEVQLVQDDGSLTPYTFGDPIAPGREMSIKALLDTANKHNQTQVRINIYANDPVAVHTLGLAANVEPYMTATPSFVNFGDLAEDAVKSSTIDVRVNTGDKVMLSIDETRRIPVPDGMTVDLMAVNPDESGRSAHWQVKMNVGPGLKEGPLGYAMTLNTDQEMKGSKPLPNGQVRYYSVSANVNGRVLGVLSCAPQYLAMGLVAPGQVIKRQVQLASHDPNFELGNPKVTIRGFQGADFPWLEHFSTSTSPIPGQNAVAVELGLDGLPDGADGSFKGEMVIETGHPRKPEMVVTFSGVCRGSIGRTGQVGAGSFSNTPRPAAPLGGQPAAGKPVGAKPVGAKPVGAKPVSKESEAEGGADPPPAQDEKKAAEAKEQKGSTEKSEQEGPAEKKQAAQKGSEATDGSDGGR